MTATSWARAHIGPIGLAGLLLVPRPLEDLLISRTAVVWIGLTLLAVAATLAVLLLREPVDGPARGTVDP